MMILIISLAVLYILIRILEKFNHVDYGNRLLNSLMGLNQIICRKYHRLGDYWLDLPEEGGAIIVANHQSGIDPPAIIAASKRPVRFLTSSYYLDIPVLRKVLKVAGCIPVYKNKDNKIALKAAVEALQKGEVIGIFPFGGFHTIDEEEPRLRTGALVLSNLAKVKLIPVYISGVSDFSIKRVLTSMTFKRSNLKMAQHESIVASDDNFQEVLDYLYDKLSNHKNAQTNIQVNTQINMIDTVSIDKQQKQATDLSN